MVASVSTAFEKQTPVGVHYLLFYLKKEKPAADLIDYPFSNLKELLAIL